MTDIESYSLFCDDVRWESNGSPIIVGVMSPVLHSSVYPIRFDSLNLFTFFRAPLSVKEFSAELNIQKITSDGSFDVGSYTANYIQDSEEFCGLEWVSISTLEINNIELFNGDYLVAKLDFEGIEKKVTLMAGPINNNDLELGG